MRGHSLKAILFGSTTFLLVVWSCAQGEGVDGNAVSVGGVGNVAGDASELGGGAGTATGGATNGGSAGVSSGGVAGSVSGGGSAGATGGNGGSTGGTGGSGATGGNGATGATGGNGGTGATGGNGGTGATGGNGGTGATGGNGGTGATGGNGGTGGGGNCDVVSWNFTGCGAGWTAAGKNADWACGSPTSGPGSDHTGGGQAWATNLSGNSAFCEDSTLTSPPVDLTPYAGLALRLRFWQWYDFRACAGGGLCGFVCAIDPSTYSGGIVEGFNGTSWVKLIPTTGYSSNPIDCYYVGDAGPTCAPSCSLDGQTGFSGTSGAWILTEIDVSSLAIQNFQFRFHFASYDNEFLCHPNKAGWYIDDVAIAKLACP